MKFRAGNYSGAMFTFVQTTGCVSAFEFWLCILHSQNVPMRSMTRKIREEWSVWCKMIQCSNGPLPMFRSYSTRPSIPTPSLAFAQLIFVTASDSKPIFWLAEDGFDYAVVHWLIYYCHIYCYYLEEYNSWFSSAASSLCSLCISRFGPPGHSHGPRTPPSWNRISHRWPSAISSWWLQRMKPLPASVLRPVGIPWYRGVPPDPEFEPARKNQKDGGISWNFDPV